MPSRMASNLDKAETAGTFRSYQSDSTGVVAGMLFVDGGSDSTVTAPSANTNPTNPSYISLKSEHFSQLKIEVP